MTPSPLWDFALDFYRRPKVESACLHLQDQEQLDVLLILWLCWQGSLGCQITADQLANAQNRVAAWQQQVISPLRQVRRTLKTWQPSVEGLRDQVKALELQAEQQALGWLSDIGAEKSSGLDRQQVVEQNLALYVQAVEKSWSAVAVPMAQLTAAVVQNG